MQGFYKKITVRVWQLTEMKHFHGGEWLQRREDTLHCFLRNSTSYTITCFLGCLLTLNLTHESPRFTKCVSSVSPLSATPERTLSLDHYKGWIYTLNNLSLRGLRFVCWTFLPLGCGSCPTCFVRNQGRREAAEGHDQSVCRLEALSPEATFTQLS